VCAVPRNRLQPESTRSLLAAIGLALAFGAVACKRAPATTTEMKPPAPQVLSAAPAPFRVWEAPIQQLQAAITGGRFTSGSAGRHVPEPDRRLRSAGPRPQHADPVEPASRGGSGRARSGAQDERPRGPLHGIPIVLKDNNDTQDLPASAGSISLGGATPSRDAFITAKLRAAGAVLLGKTNLMEFAVGITTLSSLGGQTRNPYDPARNPGGSSGGTGAAVAASLAAVGWGTDTCGSIRVPAAFNSRAGLRPTKGITSRQGIVPLAAVREAEVRPDELLHIPAGRVADPA
jgi:amidase